MRLSPLLLVACLACDTSDSGDVATTPAKPTTSVPADLVANTWQVRMAVDAARAPYEGRQSWVAYFQGQRVAAIAAMASESDATGLARLHAEYAGMYRQAALIAAHSTVQVYGVDAQPTDPAETSYLLGVAGALLGDASWRGKLGAAGASAVKDVAARDAAWKKWADAGAAWPPDEVAAGSPGVPTSTKPGETPDAGTVPHYLLPELGEGGLEVKAGDPGTLWALARWHEKMAEQASPNDAASVSILVDPWRLYGEKTAAPATVAYPDTFLFMSSTTSAGDAAFFADLAREGVSAVDKHAGDAAKPGDSAYAVLVKHCTRDEAGARKLSVDCALDEAAALGQAIEEGMAKAAGKEDSFHRAFADYARVGALRAADRAAFAYGDTDAGGRLRINTLDRATGATHTRDPLFLLSVAAWDAGNRNSVRAEELVHGLLTEVPGLEAARLPLDALHIRLSRNAAPGRPMH
ncbi:MAG: hypothetical protein ACOZNI_34310 [Myxococcota bacterium]